MESGLAFGPRTELTSANVTIERENKYIISTDLVSFELECWAKKALSV